MRPGVTGKHVFHGDFGIQIPKSGILATDLNDPMIFVSFPVIRCREPG
jgi:hypothetical protein